MFKQLCWLTAFLLYGLLSLQGQMVFISPPYPSLNDSISIYFNAEYGNQALKGVDEAIYLHTGVILGPDSLHSTWYYIQGEWARHDPSVLMEKMGPNLYRKKVHLKTFYQLPPDLGVKKLAFVFRNRDGSKVGKPIDREETWYDLTPPIPSIPEDSAQILPVVFKPLTVYQLANSDSLSQKIYLREDSLYYHMDMSLAMETLDLSQLVDIPVLLTTTHKRKNSQIEITRKDLEHPIPSFIGFRLPFKNIKQLSLNQEPLLEVQDREELEFWENSYLKMEDLLFLHLDMQEGVLSLSLKY
ncbi:MAG: hypothetical protein AAF655_03770 [Bacteroidota bacterium]